MARRTRKRLKVEKKDARYDSAIVSCLIGKVMRSGKRLLAERIVYNAIEKANQGAETVDPLEVLVRAVDNARPRVEVKSRRVGGATYQVPMEADGERARAIAISWFVSLSRAKKGVAMETALANEIKDASKNQGSAIRKRDDMHKMAQANRAFAHFRW